MRFRYLAVLAVLLMTVSASVQAEGHWPPQVPQSLEGWQAVVSGHDTSGVPQTVALANVRLQYALYSSQQHPMLYGLTNYKLEASSMTGWFAGRMKLYHGREGVVWSPESSKGYNRIFVRHRRWRELTVNSPEWKLEQGIVLRVWSVHALLGHQETVALALTF